MQQQPTVSTTPPNVRTRIDSMAAISCLSLCTTSEKRSAAESAQVAAHNKQCTREVQAAHLVSKRHPLIGHGMLAVRWCGFHFDCSGGSIWYTVPPRRLQLHRSLGP